MYKTIYIEYVFIDNLIMNILIIQLSSNIIGSKTRIWRLVLSATLGAVYAACIFLPQMGWLYSFPLKMLLCLVLVLMSWGFGGMRKYLLRVAAFAGTTFLFGGAALGMALGLGGTIVNSVIYFNGFSYRLLAISCMLSVILARMIRESIRKMRFKDGLVYRLKITFQNKNTILDAYLDTGNMLYDTLSGAPVIIINFKSIVHILPKELSSAVLSRLIYKNTEYAQAFRIHLLPYSSIGMEGILFGVRPDSIEILKDDSWVRVNAILGVSKTGLDGGIEALLHPFLLQAG